MASYLLPSGTQVVRAHRVPPQCRRASVCVSVCVHVALPLSSLHSHLYSKKKRKKKAQKAEGSLDGWRWVLGIGLAEEERDAVPNQHRALPADPFPCPTLAPIGTLLRGLRPHVDVYC